MYLGEVINNTEPLALEALKGWEYVLGYSLIPEHIECRPLFCDERPGVEQVIYYLYTRGVLLANIILIHYTLVDMRLQIQ